MTARIMINSKHLVLAADPGMSGALALLGRGELRIIRDFKTPEDIVEACRDFSNEHPDKIVIEDVHAMPGQGVCSMFSFGHSTGIMRGALLSMFPGTPLVKVAPLRWQNAIRVIAEWPKPREFDSRAIALEMFPPFLRKLFSRKKDHNSADAALMAVWGLQELGRLAPLRHSAD